MNEIREFVRSGGQGVSDGQLESLLREGMLMAPTHEQRGWLREVELALDAYATKPQLEAALRVRAALTVLSDGLSELRR